MPLTLFRFMTQATINSTFLGSLSPTEMRELAVFMKLKSLYKNSCVYGFSYRSLSFKSGVSINTLKKTIKSFLDKKWCRMHNGNLVFGKIKDVDDTDGRGVLVKFNLKKENDYKYILKVLRLSLVKACSDRFEYIKKISNDYIKPSNLESYKVARKAFCEGRLRKMISASECFSMSNRNIGSLFGRSKTTASLLMKFGVENKMLDVFSNYKEMKISPDYAVETNGHWIFKGKVYQRKSNKISFTVSFF